MQSTPLNKIVLEKAIHPIGKWGHGHETISTWIRLRTLREMFPGLSSNTLEEEMLFYQLLFIYFLSIIDIIWLTCRGSGKLKKKGEVSSTCQYWFILSVNENISKGYNYMIPLLRTLINFFFLQCLMQRIVVFIKSASFSKFCLHMNKWQCRGVVNSILSQRQSY